VIPPTWRDSSGRPRSRARSPLTRDGGNLLARDERRQRRCAGGDAAPSCRWYSGLAFHLALWVRTRRRASWHLAFSLRATVSRRADMPDEAILREKARATVQSGKLPARRPDRTWGAPGVGAPCTICAVPMRRDEMEFEIQFERDGASPGMDKYHIHVRCFSAWEFERRERRRAEGCEVESNEINDETTPLRALLNDRPPRRGPPPATASSDLALRSSWRWVPSSHASPTTRRTSSPTR
jgi:hypothetical protein